MVKEPAIGQRSMLASSFRDRPEVILKSGNFLNLSLLAATNYGWLGTDSTGQCGVPDLSFYINGESAEGWAS
jgi:hypothetical protein